MAYVVIYDACVLHDPALRDLMIRLATKRQLNLRAINHSGTFGRARSRRLRPGPLRQREPLRPLRSDRSRNSGNKILAFVGAVAAEGAVADYIAGYVPIGTIRSPGGGPARPSPP